MFKQIKKLFKRKPKQFIVLGNKSFTKDQAIAVQEKTGQLVILAHDVNDVRIVGEDTKEILEGDGKAVFIGAGTYEEYLEDEREANGLKGWYERLKNL